MKPLRKHLKLIALFLTITFLMQSCKVNSYKPTTLNGAIGYYKLTGFDENAESRSVYKTKVKTQHRTYVFAKIETENEEIFGFEKRNTGYNKIPLEQYRIIEIQTQRKDKALSIILGVGVPFVIIGGLMYSGVFAVGPF